MGAISLELANFLALVLETLLYGSFTVLFFAAIYVIIYKRTVINITLLSTVSAIWILSTVHLVLDILRATEAFVRQKDGGPLLYYLNLSNPLQAAKTAVYVTLTLVGDGFVIFRCFIVWGRTWWIIPFPLMLLLGTAIAGFGATYEFSHAAPGAEVFLPAIVPWITSFIALTLSTNVVCTSLIVFRLLRVHRAVKDFAQSGVAKSVLIMVMESAAVYSASVISLMITYSLESNAQYTVLDLTAPLIGITFSVIILRVSLGISSRELTQVSQPNSSGRSTGGGTFALARRAVAVNVSVEVDSDDLTGDDTSMSKRDGTYV
ncbi:hypothetical protein EYR36_001999 [Pleurotus pulmonarius]|nr:hypothetical protein EYR36_001999 [Pleurotus pulmonarius]KAF4588251.1 hypothetical protein EYR38_010218 [Pleurotus pulmonarius]